MTTLDIRRMVIDAPHLGEADGKRLAERIADGLRCDVPWRDESAVIGDIRISVDAGGDVDTLARSVVAELLRQIRS
ncbi:MAG TPA: hypothetical protein VF713_25525 [Thermoanaerobaculia bacterium]